MTKADIIEQVVSRVAEFSKKQVAEHVELVFQLVKETLARGEKVKISRFGAFVVRDKKDRVGRNPQTGETLTISSRSVVNFKPSPVLREEMNNLAKE